MSDIIAAKARLRATAIERRNGLAAELRRAAAERVCAIGISFASPPAGAVVSGFMAIGSEIDPYPLLARLSKEGHRLALPVIAGKGRPLSFRSWSPGAPLATRSWGIREPLAEAAEVEPDILIVPLLAFDAHGFRLGYGAGYYDRTLKRLRAMKSILAIGLAYEEQEIEAVPHHEEDERLDWVLTPSGPRRAI
ncbi:MAG TPA: 5-formyltetrahydrofolate cyclo-ligase [Hyphomicrobiaceae bacterium]|nr:5-formyltetrahydrofolate cyclo-ligase [Hyphomicrobiaceae bacterium]